MNEDALVKALESGQVWSAGLDVFEEEPKVHQGLIDNPHIMLVPHMGTVSYIYPFHLLSRHAETNVSATVDYRDSNQDGNLVYRQCTKCR